MQRANLVGVAVPVQPADRDLAGIGPGETFDHFQRRGLAGTVRPEEAEDLAGGDGEVDAGDGEHVRELLAQSSDDDLFRHRGRVSRFARGEEPATIFRTASEDL